MKIKKNTTDGNLKGKPRENLEKKTKKKREKKRGQR